MISLARVQPRLKNFTHATGSSKHVCHTLLEYMHIITTNERYMCLESDNHDSLRVPSCDDNSFVDMFWLGREISYFACLHAS